MNKQIETPTLDRQLAISNLILKLLEDNNCTYGEWNFVNNVVNDVIKEQQKELYFDIIIEYNDNK